MIPYSSKTLESAIKILSSIKIRSLIAFQYVQTLVSKAMLTITKGNSFKGYRAIGVDLLNNMIYPHMLVKVQMALMSILGMLI